MKFIDVTVGIEPKTVVWPSDAPIKFEAFKSTKKGDKSNALKLSFGTHTGSHVDAPLHFGFSGTVDKMRLEALIGTALVVDVKSSDAIRPEHFAHVNLEKYRRILFRTKNSKRIGDGQFHKDFVAFSPESAKELAKHRPLLVGIDAMSVDPYHGPAPAAHNAMLSKKIILLENINLKNVAAGEYELYCLPLKLMGADGAPARVILGKK